MWWPSSALLVLLLFHQSRPALQESGLGILTSSFWHPGEEKFGMLAFPLWECGHFSFGPPLGRPFKCGGRPPYRRNTPPLVWAPPRLFCGNDRLRALHRLRPLGGVLPRPLGAQHFDPPPPIIAPGEVSFFSRAELWSRPPDGLPYFGLDDRANHHFSL